MNETSDSIRKEIYFSNKKNIFRWNQWITVIELTLMEHTKLQFKSKFSTIFATLIAKITKIYAKLEFIEKENAEPN